MTLIIGALAQGVAHQVGDRLVSAVGLGAPYDHDPLSNKQVIIVAQDALVSAGYTGSAYLGGRPTDDIIAEAAAGRPLGTGMSFTGATERIYVIVNRIAARLNDEVDRSGNTAFGVEVALIGIKHGKHERTEPLVWEIHKRPGKGVQIRRSEDTPFDWRTEFILQFVGNADISEIEQTRADIKATTIEGEARRDEITRRLVDTVRRISDKRVGVGRDCMAVRLWRDGLDVITEARFDPETRHTLAVQVSEENFTFPAAYSPWFISPAFVASPAVVKGAGGWTVGRIQFRIHAPEYPSDSGKRLFFGSQDRRPPPS